MQVFWNMVPLQHSASRSSSSPMYMWVHLLFPPVWTRVKSPWYLNSLVLRYKLLDQHQAELYDSNVDTKKHIIEQLQQI